MPLVCPLCPAERTSNLTYNTRDYLKHIQLFHLHQPDFKITCGISGCRRTFQTFSVFRNHISDKHSSDSDPTNQSCVANNTSDEDDADPDAGPDADPESDGESEIQSTLSTLETSTALFLMGLKEERKLTQTALQGIFYTSWVSLFLCGAL